MADTGKNYDTANLKHADIQEINHIADDLRTTIMDVVSRNGGHLASNLGVVELTLALHRVFQSPKDKIIWDVGHQTYSHKILTGRKEAFSSLRKFGGISGFPKREESPHDCFNTGHSSTAISAALGFCRARELLKQDHHVVAVIGDGAFTGGMVWEAMNDAGHNQDRIIVILNDNEMSITRNVGAMSGYLSRMRSNHGYERFKSGLAKMLFHIPRVGKRIVYAMMRMKNSVKYLIMPGMFFEEIGFMYMGPVDGHDTARLTRALEMAKEIKRPVLLHVVTQKGKGYEFSEKDPEKFHATAPFEWSGQKPDIRERSVCYAWLSGSLLTAMADKDHRICAITASMMEGSGLTQFAERFPNRFFDVGIAEEHAVTMAAGLAACGMRPFFMVYASFLQRAYDQILHDVCLQNLPVVFGITHTGLVGPDGETHQGIYTLSMLRSIPNIVIMAPSCGEELRDMMELAVALSMPVAICYAKDDVLWAFAPDTGGILAMRWQSMICCEQGARIAILAVGRMVRIAVKASEILSIPVDVYNCRFIRPLDEDMLRLILARYDRIYTLEDNEITGGFGSGILEYVSESSMRQHAHVKLLGHRMPFVQHGNVQELLDLTNLSPEKVALTIQKDCEEENSGI